MQEDLILGIEVSDRGSDTLRLSLTWQEVPGGNLSWSNHLALLPCADIGEVPNCSQ